MEEMGYFFKVTMKGQKLKDMDISVHCDLLVFDWLIKWAKAKVFKSEDDQQPKLDPSNVIGLMVSAEFLQMPTLTSKCVKYTADNIVDVIHSSPNLGCLNETLTLKLCEHFSNLDVEKRIWRVDKNDRITSRIYTHFIVMLNQNRPDKLRGHYSSSSSLFKCLICGRMLTNDVANKIPCLSMKLDSKGKLYATHVKDNHWSLNSFIRDLKRDLKSWRRVYWRLWSTVHFLPCSSCQLLFPLKDYASCRYHPKFPQLQINVLKATGEIQERILNDPPTRDANSPEKEVCVNPYRRVRELEMLGIAKAVEEERENEILFDSVLCGFGVYPCCRRPGYKFHPLPETNGCQFREHSIISYAEDDSIKRILQTLEQVKDLIVVTPKSKEMRRQSFHWGEMMDLAPQKRAAAPSSSFPYPNLYPQQTPVTLRPQSVKVENSPISTDPQTNSPSPSPTDKGGGGTQGTSDETASGGHNNDIDKHSENISQRLESHQSYHNYVKSGQSMSDFWFWNNDFTTRYNQDMQRESEEKLMSDLELLLSQRVSLDPSGQRSSSSCSSSTLRMGYYNRRDPKYLGGSFWKLEEQWKEEQRKHRQSAFIIKPGISTSSLSLLPLPQNPMINNSNK